MCLITVSCDPSWLRWCCPQTCPPISSKSKGWRPACNSKSGNVDRLPFKLRAATLRFCRMNVQSSCLTFAAHGGKLASRWLALFILKHVKTQQKQECPSCFRRQDRQAQSAVSVAPHSRHKPSIQALGVTLSLDQGPDGGVFPAGRYSNRCDCSLSFLLLSSSITRFRFYCLITRPNT